jgi:hypothetical protein
MKLLKMEELNILEKELNLIQKDFDNVSSVLVNLMNVASKKQDILSQPRFVFEDFEQYLIKLVTHDVLPTKKERFAVANLLHKIQSRREAIALITGELIMEDIKNTLGNLGIRMGMSESLL